VYIYLQDEMKTSTDNSDYELWVILDQARDVMSKAREMELHEFKLSKAQAYVLHRLVNEETPLTVSEICRESAKKRSSVASLLSRMVKNGLVTMSGTDARNGVISVTAKGRESYGRVKRRSIEMIFSVLSDEKVIRLTSILQRIRGSARALLDQAFHSRI
jgi:DNA-binding MarR family transcriptional regulator